MQATEFRDLLLVREAAVQALRNHYQTSELLEVSVPVLVGITGACENVSTLFRIAAETPVHLTQTGQLALEHALCHAKGVYCFTPSFRTDVIDHRHLSEFTLVEEEISCDHLTIGMSRNQYDPRVMFEVLLMRIENAVKSAIERCTIVAPEALERSGGDLTYLTGIMESKFHRITYSDALELLNSAEGGHRPWGGDLSAVDEHKLLDLIAQDNDGVLRPTFITHYPERIKFFNMMVDESDPRVVLSADLVLPHAGEAVGSAVREHRYEYLVRRLTASIMFAHVVAQKLAALEDFEPYLNIIREGLTSPHAGYGIGLERLLQFMIGQRDIRRASVAYALTSAMGFSEAIASVQPGSRSPGF